MSESQQDAARPRITLAVDIETVGLDWEGLDEGLREYLLGRARDEVEREAVPHRLALSPGTGRIICIGVWNVEGDAGGVLYEGEDSGGWVPGEDENHRVLRGDEATILRAFWEMAARFKRIVTYNGRAFDGPYLMIRSAFLGVKPSRQLVGNRYHPENVDLADLLTFFGAWRLRYSLDFWCRRFGITSPKDGGIDGSKVQEVYDRGGIEEIAKYCAGDARATARLYQALEPTLVQLSYRGPGR